MCIYISILLSLLYCAVTQCIPKFINRIILSMGLLILFALIVCAWTYPTVHIKSKIIAGLVIMGLFIIIAIIAYLFQEAVKANGVFLEQATILLSEKPLIFMNIIPFIIVLAAFCWMMILELNSFLTNS